jgi:hypothetical protein
VGSLTCPLLSSHAQEFEASLWKGNTALHYLQLLPSPAAVQFRTGTVPIKWGEMRKRNLLVGNIDFNVWSGKKIRENLEYMHQNPVKRGLVAVPAHWMCSSYNYCEGVNAPLMKMDRM